MPTSRIPFSLRAFAYISIALGIFALGFALLCGSVFHLGAPYRFVLSGDARGFDLWYTRLMVNVHQYSFYPAGKVPEYLYPAADILLYLPWVHVPHRVSTFELLVLIIFVSAALSVGRAMLTRGITQFEAFVFMGVSVIFSYPMWFEWRQTNVEVFVFLLLAGALFCYVKGHFNMAAILIGLAAALKISPFVFLALFVSRRQYRAVLLSVASGIVLTLICLFVITPSFMYSVHGVANGLGTYDRATVQTLVPRAAGFDHSVFTVVKYITYFLTGNLERVRIILHVYLAVVGLLGAGIFWRSVRFLPLINQVLLLTLAATFLMPSSFDYTLMHLYIPWVMLLLLAVKQKNHVRGLLAVFVCLALLTSPETFLIFHGRTYSGQFKSVIGLLLLYLALRFPFQSEFDDRIAQAFHSQAARSSTSATPDVNG